MILNQIKTILLLGLLTALLLFIGSFWSYTGLTIALIFVLLMNFFVYFYSDKMVLAIYGAKEVSKAQAPELHEIIGDICKKAKLPKPKIYIIPKEFCNAFATGRNSKHAAVAVTQGILKLLTKEELKGVLAHEIAHIKNKDMLIATIAATIAGIITYVAMMARFAAIFGGARGGRDSGRSLELLFLAILAPIIALIIRLAISRSREYLADETGAKLIKKSSPLANALLKLHSAARVLQLKKTSQSEITSHLFIVNPFSGKSLLTLFSTHPPVSERCKRLKNLKF